MTLSQPGLYTAARPPDDSKLRFAASELARHHAWRLVVLFGSAAGGEAARDLDLAVLPAAMPSLLTQEAWLEERLAPWPVDLLPLGDETSPVARFEVFRQGRCLFEAEPGLFSREQDRAFLLYADSEPIRRQMREVLLTATSPEVMDRELAFLRRFVADLAGYARLDDTGRRREHYAIERLLQLLCEAAADIRPHFLRAGGTSIRAACGYVMLIRNSCPRDMSQPWPP